MVQAQKNKWILYPTEVDFDAGPSYNPVNFTGPAMPYQHENAVYDAAGNLIFYYQDGNIFNAQGGWEGGNPYFSGTSNGEVVILPVPGLCQSYCIFTIRTAPLVTFSIFMQEVTLNPDGSLYVSGVNYLDGDPNTSPLFGNTGSLGASKIIPGSIADRFLYVAVNAMGQVRRYKLDATGIAFDGVAASFMPNNSTGSSELEIAPSEPLMAWSGGNTVYLTDFVSPTDAINFEGVVTGLEFSIDSKFLLASIFGKGIAVIPVTNISAYAYIPNSLNFDRTYLEAGKDRRIYCVHRNGNLYAIEADLNTFTATEVGVHSYSSFMHWGYALPDQIDGEGDELFYGVVPLQVHNLSVDQLDLPGSVGGIIPAFYNCDNIDLALEYAGVPTSYTVSIYSVDPITGLQVSGPPFLDYFHTFPGSPPAAIDLRCIEDPVNCDLFDGYFSQTFAVEIKINDRCTSAERKGYFRVFDAPASPAEIKMEVQPGIGICLPSHDPSSPCLVGLYSAAIRLSNSSGDITFYRITIDETDCSTGNVIQNIYQGPITPINSAFSLPIGLNAIEINGNTGYFVLNDFIGRCIKVSAEVGNNCGSSADFSYLRFNGYYLGTESEGEHLLGSGTISNGEDLSGVVAIFPNPARNAWQVRLLEWPVENIAIMVMDATGRPVRRLRIEAGATDISIPAADLAPGAYYYRLTGGQQSVSGVLLKQ